jgi:hypothetical protein
MLKQITGDTYANTQVMVKQTRTIAKNYQAHKKPYARVRRTSLQRKLG